MARLSTRRGAQFALHGAAALLALHGAPALAQKLDYGNVDDASGGGDAGGDASGKGRGGHSIRSAGGGARTTIQPYLEVSQNLLAELKPGDDVLTYTAIAAGVDVALNGRNTQGAVSFRYERRITEKGNTANGDTISGLARVKHDLIPRTLSVEAGGLATRTRVDATGAGSLNPVATSSATTQIYSAYAGPALATHVGDVGVNGSYMVGYTKVDTKNGVTAVPGQPSSNIFDHSLSQSAQLSAGVRPGVIAPVGVTASGRYAQEDISNLDQRYRELNAGVQVTLPVTQDLALVGDVGYQDVQVSARDAVYDVNGLPVIGSNGRFVTDKSKPRAIAYDFSGLSWDAGVMWRPSRRTSLSAFVGRRYDSTTYYGSFSYAPNARSALGISVYDGISGFGSSLGNALRDVPTDFEVGRDPFNGNISGCGIGSTGGGCVNGALASLSSSVFRARGVNATYGMTVGRLRAGIGAGYVRRKFIAARGTVLGLADGTVDESWYVDGGVSGRLDRRSSFAVAVYSAWYNSGSAGNAKGNAVGANASYFRNLTDRLVGSAAVGIDGFSRKAAPDELVASGRIALRYNF